MVLTILVGPPGSGKDTYIKNNFPNFTLVNQDEQGKTEHLTIFKQAIERGDNIAVARMNFSKEQRNRYIQPAKELGYNIQIVVLHENYKTCHTRCIARQGHPSIKTTEDATKALNFFFSKYERVEDTEADLVARIWPEGVKPNAIYCDIDNTLSDANHRQHFVQNKPKNWKKFFDLMGNDPVNEWCKKILEGFYYYHMDKIILCSGRPENYRYLTERWLHTNRIPYHELIMRKEKDSRPDYIVKGILYEFEIKTKFNVILGLDDRKQVIDENRRLGMLVLDCAGEKGNF